jgi:hypothetical protein
MQDNRCDDARPRGLTRITITRPERDALFWWCDTELTGEDTVREREGWMRVRTAGELLEQIGWQYDDPRETFTLTFDAAMLERTLYRALDDLTASLRDEVQALARYRAGEMTDEDLGFDAAAWAQAVCGIVEECFAHREGVVQLLARLGGQSLDTWRG